MTEEDFIKKVIPRLEMDFILLQEVWDTTGTCRIDRVLQLKKDRSVYFGIEFKKIEEKRGEQLGEHIKQGNRYSTKNFLLPNGNDKRMPIFLCPPISYISLICPSGEPVISNGLEHYQDRHDKSHQHHTVNGMLGVFNVGELRTTTYKEKKYLWFLFSNQIIWDGRPQWNSSEVRGLHKDNYEKLLKKINSYK